MATALDVSEDDPRPKAVPRAEGGGGTGTPWRLLPLAVPVAVLAVTGFTHRWMTDDGFIYLRIVRQILAGNGPVFNAGERVEAYTSPAWTAMLTTGDVVLPFQLEWIAVLLGLACALVGVAAAMSGALHITAHPGQEATGRLAVPVGALVVVAPFVSWVWATSGHETGLTWAWLGVSAAILGRWAATTTARVGRAGLVVLGLGWLVRPELALFSALFLGVVLAGEWARSGWRARARTVAWAVAVPVAYQVFRMGYFGMLVANTATAKEGTSTHWGRGYDYLRDFADPYWLWVPAVAVLLGGYLPLFARADLRRRLVAGAFLVGAVLLGLYVVAVGGDYMHGRFFYPVLFAAFAPLAAVRVERRYAGLAAVVPWAAASLFVLRPPHLDGAFLAEGTFLPKDYGSVTLADSIWGPDAPQRRVLDGTGIAVESGPFGMAFERADFTPAPDLRLPAALVTGVGAAAYAMGTDYYVVDPLGLASPIGSHFESMPGRGLPGHEKPAPPEWIAAWLAASGSGVRPEDLGTSGRFPASAYGRDFDEQVGAVRHVMRCGEVRQLQDAASGHLGPRRFLRNLLQAPSNTFVRIPRDPVEARERFC